MRLERELLNPDDYQDALPMEETEKEETEYRRRLKKNGPDIVNQMTKAIKDTDWIAVSDFTFS